MSKAKVLPFTGNWHLELAEKGAPDAKARKALEAAQVKDAAKAYPRARKAIIPAVGWSDPKEQLYTVDELAKHFKVKPSSIYKAVREGRLIPERFGKVLRFSRAEIDSFKTRQHLKNHG